MATYRLVRVPADPDKGDPVIVDRGLSLKEVRARCAEHDARGDGRYCLDYAREAFYMEGSE